jgi:hypothetical protein
MEIFFQIIALKIFIRNILKIFFEKKGKDSFKKYLQYVPDNYL